MLVLLILFGRANARAQPVGCLLRRLLSDSDQIDLLVMSLCTECVTAGQLHGTRVAPPPLEFLWFRSTIMSGSIDMVPGDKWSTALSPREHEVALLVARGLTNKEVARELALCEGTVKLHVHSIFQKLGATSRYDLIVQRRPLEENHALNAVQSFRSRK